MGVFSTVGGIDRLIKEHDPVPECDYRASLMSLPFVYSTTFANMPAHCPYIAADSVKAAQYGEMLSGLPGKKIGIVWRGNPDHQNDAHRSIDSACFIKLLSLPDCTFIGLQKDADAGELGVFAGYDNFVDFSGSLDDFTVTAAVIANLDLVIACDTSVVHLAGALRRPAWVLLRVIPDWRWLMDRDDTPWYPTVRLFRQSRDGDWSGVMEDVASALGEM